MSDLEHAPSLSWSPFPHLFNTGGDKDTTSPDWQVEDSRIHPPSLLAWACPLIPKPQFPCLQNGEVGFSPTPPPQGLLSPLTQEDQTEAERHLWISFLRKDNGWACSPAPTSNGADFNHSVPASVTQSTSTYWASPVLGAGVHYLVRELDPTCYNYRFACHN